MATVVSPPFCDVATFRGRLAARGGDAAAAADAARAADGAEVAESTLAPVEKVFRQLATLSAWSRVDVGAVHSLPSE